MFTVGNLTKEHILSAINKVASDNSPALVQEIVSHVLVKVNAERYWVTKVNLLKLSFYTTYNPGLPLAFAICPGALKIACSPPECPDICIILHCSTSKGSFNPSIDCGISIGSISLHSFCLRINMVAVCIAGCGLLQSTI